jgi:secreted trypsin-like serine protease
MIMFLLFVCIIISDVVVVNTNPENTNVWPWFVSLEHANGTHKCDGALIANTWVLTSASCLGRYVLLVNQTNYLKEVANGK